MHDEPPNHITEEFAEDDDRLLSAAETKILTGLSKTTQWRERKAGRFPPLLPPTNKNSLGQIREYNRQRRARAEEAQRQAVAGVTRAPGRPPKAPPQAAAE